MSRPAAAVEHRTAGTVETAAAERVRLPHRPESGGEDARGSGEEDDCPPRAAEGGEKGKTRRVRVVHLGA
nr:unnamed protein product [Digitaria exilis]